MGVVIQVNSTSLCGWWGRGIQKKTLKLLKAQIPHIFASDAHDLDVRTPALDDCAARPEGACGERYTEDLLRRNPLKIRGIG